MAVGPWGCPGIGPLSASALHVVCDISSSRSAGHPGIIRACRLTGWSAAVAMRALIACCLPGVGGRGERQAGGRRGVADAVLHGGGLPMTCSPAQEHVAGLVPAAHVLAAE